jgi:hypothetical protein
LLLFFFFLLFLEFWTLSNSIMYFFVKLFTWIYASFFKSTIPFRELSLIIFLAFIFQLFDIVINMNTKYSFSVYFGIIFFFFTIFNETWESFDGVWDIKTTIKSSF